MMEFVVCIIAMVVSFMPFIGFANVIASYLAGFGYTVLVPRVYLINNDDQKNLLLENELYLKFNNKFLCVKMLFCNINKTYFVHTYYIFTFSSISDHNFKLSTDPLQEAD